MASGYVRSNEVHEASVGKERIFDTIDLRGNLSMRGWRGICCKRKGELSYLFETRCGVLLSGIGVLEHFLFARLGDRAGNFVGSMGEASVDRTVRKLGLIRTGVTTEVRQARFRVVLKTVQ